MTKNNEGQAVFIIYCTSIIVIEGTDSELAIPTALPLLIQ
jgi:hypothetical protein